MTYTAMGCIVFVVRGGGSEKDGSSLHLKNT